jgi:hypothetical protein
LSLESVFAHNVQLSGASFAPNSRITLQHAEFTKIEARWPVLEGRLVYNGAAYLALVRSYKNMEWFDDADDCYYRYRKSAQREKNILVYGELSHRGIPSINWSKALDILALISCGYGVRPRHTVFLSIILIALFGIAFWIGEGVVEEPIEQSTGRVFISLSDQGFCLVDGLYFSAMVFTAKTQVKWYPVGLFRYVATIESILGWLLMALLLVTLGRTMIR